MAEQDQRISEAIEEERPRLRNFIRRRVSDDADVDDLLQEVIFELVQANRLLKPIDYVTGWLYRVARNRITDFFRKKNPESFASITVTSEEGEVLQVEDLFAAADDDPETLYLRGQFFGQFEAALAELPVEQRAVFIAHEMEGRSFKEISAETSVNINTLLARKRYAVLLLRERLQDFYDEITKK